MRIRIHNCAENMITLSGQYYRMNSLHSSVKISIFVNMNQPVGVDVGLQTNGSVEDVRVTF